MFVSRWGLLRRALPKSIHITKVPALTMCLAKLHNFCITERLLAEDPAGKKKPSFARSYPLPSLAVDEAEIVVHGGVPLDTPEDCDERDAVTPGQLLHGGQHFDDVPYNLRRNATSRGRSKQVELPNEVMLKQVEYYNLKRPKPKQWSTTKRK